MIVVLHANDERTEEMSIQLLDESTDPPTPFLFDFAGAGYAYGASIDGSTGGIKLSFGVTDQSTNAFASGTIGGSSHAMDPSSTFYKVHPTIGTVALLEWNVPGLRDRSNTCRTVFNKPLLQDEIEEEYELIVR